MLPSGHLLGARSDKVGGDPAGVQIRPPNYEKFSSRVIFTIPATDAQSTAYYAFLDAQLGKPYDSEAIWAFAFNRDWREDDSWICSELQAAALIAANRVPPLFLASNKITPEALALMASAIGATFVAGPS